VDAADIINTAVARAAAQVAEQFSKLHAGTLPFAQTSMLPCCILMTRLLHNAVVTDGSVQLCFKQHWPDDILLVNQLACRLFSILPVYASWSFCLPPLRPHFAGGQQQLVDEVRSWNSSRTVEASKLSLSDLLLLRRLLRMYVVPEGAEVSAVLDPSACDSGFEW
jgi:hypothetical protein